MESALKMLSALALAGACTAASSFGQDGPFTRPAQLAALQQAVNRPHVPRVRHWRIAARVLIPGKVTEMLSVTAPTPGDGWAIGLSAEPARQTGSTIVEHWSGRRWRRVPVPRKVLSAFDAGYPPYAVIGASSQSNVWAFNQMNDMWLRWNGDRWRKGSVAKHPRVSRIGINSTLVLAADDVWIFGFRLNSQDNIIPYTARFNGRRWEEIPLPAGPALPVSAATAVSPTDIWAVIGRSGDVAGAPGPSGGAMVHWNGHRWRSVPLPATLARHGDPASITAFSDKDIWVGGGTANDDGGLTESTAHWNGKNWQVAQFPATATPALFVLSSIARDGRKGMQALATCFTCANPGSESRLWRLSADRWTGPIRPRLTRRSWALTDLTQAGRSMSAWATGFTAAGTAVNGMIALYGPTPR